MSASPIDTEQHYLDNVTRLRKERGLTQQALADRLAELGADQLTRASIAKVEKGGRKLRWHEALAMAKALDVDPAELAAGGDAATPIAVTPGLTMTALELRQWLRGSDEVWTERMQRHLEALLALVGSYASAAQRGEDAEHLLLAIEAMVEQHRLLQAQREGGER